MVERIPEIERVSPPSESVSLEIRSMRVFVESSATVAESAFATGAELVQLIVTVPVAIFESHPEASRARYVNVPVPHVFIVGTKRTPVPETEAVPPVIEVTPVTESCMRV